MVIERARIIIGALLVRVGARLLNEGGPGAPFADDFVDEDSIDPEDSIAPFTGTIITEKGKAMIFTPDGDSQEPSSNNPPVLRGSLRARFGDPR